MNTRDIWIHKDTDDFLNYLKFEYQQVVMVAVSASITAYFYLFQGSIFKNMNSDHQYISTIKSI